MTVNELRKALMSIISEYFSELDTVVVWSEQQKLVKSAHTFVTLKLSNLQEELHYNNITDDDNSVDYQPSQIRLTIQLFTHGGKETVEDEDGATYELPVNTAVNDLMDLDKYLASQYVIELCDGYDITILRDGMAQDISAVVDTIYEYRAIQEYLVGFTQTSKGKAGISRTDWKPTASGGGTTALAEMETGYIEQADISENKE